VAQVMTGGIRFSVYGIKETKRILKEHAPDLRRQMDATIRTTILGPVLTTARSMVPSEPPLSRWNEVPKRPGSRASTSQSGKRWEYGRLQWDSGSVVRQIKVLQGGRRQRGQVESALWRIVNMSAAGAVFETMGRRTKGQMTQNVQGQHGAASRVIWRAWDQTGAEGWAPQQIIATVRDFEAKLQQRLAAASSVED
jgi:hypothetical protein